MKRVQLNHSKGHLAHFVVALVLECEIKGTKVIKRHHIVL